MIGMILAESFTVVTYGGGEILQKIFQAISMLFNGGNGGLVRPLMVICASIGGFYAFSKAFFSAPVETLLIRYLFPLIIIVSTFMIKSTTVHIEDILKKSNAGGEIETSLLTVNHVPWLLGKFAETVSTIGYKVAQGIEHEMHTPNDANYNATGMIFGSEAVLDMTRYRLTNANLEQNFKLFAKQCVLYDIALSRYSLDDLKKSADLWEFFEKKTSNVRMMRYCPPDAGNTGFNKCTYETCKSAIAKMKPYFEKDKEHYAKLEIGKNLPLTFQALTGMQKDRKELIGQQLTMNVLTDELSGGNFAKNRAYTQQQSTYRTMGSLAANGLVTMRIVFESLIYATFIFILPLSLTPAGFKYLINWAWLVIWIQMWPPLYAILNYIMQLAARYKFDGWFSGLTSEQRGLSLFTSIGLQNLNDDVFALAAFLSVSVPYISYILLKEGLSSFVQLAGSLMAPAQNAAASAAAEQASGNYSFANASYGQMAYNNTSGFQTNVAPMVSSSYFIENQGEFATTYGNDGQPPVVKQSSSDLRTGVGADAAIGKNLQIQKQEAQSSLNSLQDNYSNSLAICSRYTSDLVTHIGDSSNYSENLSQREGSSIQSNINSIRSISENWGRQFGFNARDSLDYLVGAALSGGGDISIASLKANIGSSFGSGAARDEVINSALNVAKSESFQENIQQITDYAKSEAFNSSHDEGKRYSDGIANSLDQLNNIQESYQAAKTHLVQSSENASWYEQNSHLVKRSLNQDFVGWATEKFTKTGGFDKVKEILSRDCESEVQPLMREFIQHIRSDSGEFSSVKGATFYIPGFGEDFKMREEAVSNKVSERAYEVQDKVQRFLPDSFSNQDKEQALSHQYSSMNEKYDFSSKFAQKKINDHRDHSIKKFDQANEKFLIERLVKGPNKSKNLVGKCMIKEAPFWYQGDE